MPYRKEVFENNYFYHVIPRRFDDQPLFRNDRDRLRFLLSAHIINRIPPYVDPQLGRWNNTRMLRVLNGEDPLPKELRKYPTPLVRVSKIALMSNHVHFLLEQLTRGGIQKFTQRLQNSYGKFFNTKYKRRGPLFEGPFKAIPISSDRHLRYVVGYITMNPLDIEGIEWRRVLLKKPWKEVKKILDNYPWSSYHHYMGKENFSALVDGGLIKDLFPTPEKFEKHLKQWSLVEHPVFDI